VGAFFGDGAFHQEDEEDEAEGNGGEDGEGIEISKGRGLLLAQLYRN
jgi:hypothetical protein